MKIILYSTNCPRCKVLEAKLTQKNINFELCTDVNTMLGLGISTAPILSIDNELLEFSNAVKWINSMEG